MLGVSLCGWMALGQSRGGNWPTFGGDAQRSGWAATDAAINRDSVKDMQLLWKLKFETQSRGARPVMPPLILGRLISYRGFRELAFVATNADIVYSLDADLGTVFWLKHLEYSTRDPQVMTSSWRCPGGLTAMPTMPVAGRGGAAGRGAPAPGQRGSPFIGGPGSVYAISSDGRLHRLNTSTGDDITQPVSVIPANAKPSSLILIDNVIYTVTSHECGNAPNAVWAIDLSIDPIKVRSFKLDGSSGWSLGGAAIGSDGTVYVRSEERLVALSPRELQLKNSWVLRETKKEDIALADISPAPSPVVLSYENRDVIVSDCETDQLCLFDSTSPAGSGAGTPMYKTPPIAQPARNAASIAERGVWGSLTTWQEMDGTRWVLASVLGPPHADLKVPVTNGPAPNGFIVAFKVLEREGKRILEPAWVSRDLHSPLPPVVTNGVVFALSAGEFTRQVQKTADDLSTLDERPRGSTRATLYALDSRTGKELYSSKNLVTVPAALTGLTVASGRVYFGGADGSFYAFGMWMEK
jgi:outer membrane protein assembly factor BamB